MKIEINLDILREFKLSANQYLLLYMMSNNELDRLDYYIKECKFPYEEIEDLVRRRYIHNTSEIDGCFTSVDIIVRKRLADDLFGKPADMFEELYQMYPVKVRRPDGHEDYLRKDLKRCKTKYNNITKKSKRKHLHILSMLELELSTRKREGKMQYMKTLPNWLSSNEWETTEQRINEVKQPIKQEVGYGESIL